MGWRTLKALSYLDALTRAALRPEFVYRHYSTGGSVMWDNACLLHRREAFEQTGNRCLKRAIIHPSPERYICPQPG